MQLIRVNIKMSFLQMGPPARYVYVKEILQRSARWLKFAAAYGFINSDTKW